MTICTCKRKNSKLRAFRIGQDRLETVMSIICIVEKLRELKSEGIDFSKVIDLNEPEAQQTNEGVVTNKDGASKLSKSSNKVNPNDKSDPNET